MSDVFADRLKAPEALPEIAEKICRRYGIGDLCDFAVVTTGYEDVNVKIKTSKGNFLIKIFAKNRTRKEIIRYVAIMEKALEAGITIPPLLTSFAPPPYKSKGMRGKHCSFIKEWLWC